MLKSIFSAGKIKSNSIRILLWATTLAVLCGAIGLGDPIEYTVESARNRLREAPVSGDIVVAGIDNEALEEIGSWPWPAERQAELVDRLDAAGAKRIFFGYDLEHEIRGSDTSSLQASFARARAETYLPSRFEVDARTGQQIDYQPSPELLEHSHLVNASMWVDTLAGVQSLPYAKTIKDKTVPGLASRLAGMQGAVDEEFPIDFAIDPYAIPYIGVGDIFSGSSGLSLVRGKDVIVGANSKVLGDRYPALGQGRLSAVMLHAMGAETLKHGRPVPLGWIAPLLVALAFAALHLAIRNPWAARAMAVTSIGSFLFVPLLLEANSIHAQVIPALLLLAIAFGMSAWSRHSNSVKTRGLTNSMSGLPNLNALRQAAEKTEYGLVAARVHNYTEVTTALAYEDEKELVRQIASRLSFGTAGATLYHGDEGLFLWLVAPEDIDSVGDQLIALHAIFQSALLIDERKIDLSITFGIDIDADRQLQNRISGAVYSAQEAFENGEKWRAYDPSKIEATEWKISMLGEMDSAIDSDEVWVAFQPKLDLKTGLICGAEALVRWTHPEKGPINPAEFVLAAEKHNRIDKLTHHVMDRAVAAALSVITRDHDISMSVNLSPRMLTNSNLELMVRQVSEKYGLPLDFLMLEITETAAMSNTDDAVKQLERMRDIGVKLSIDDYGTGYSTLEYLKRCPASELKIDRSFISNLTTSRSDRIMVNSTIELAHSLDQTVVAEGVEDNETLDILREMGCDVAQGFLIGRPMDLTAFSEYIDTRNQKPRAANG